MSVVAVTVAVRGERSRKASSPKKSPGAERGEPLGLLGDGGLPAQDHEQVPVHAPLPHQHRPGLDVDLGGRGDDGPKVLLGDVREQRDGLEVLDHIGWDASGHGALLSTAAHTASSLFSLASFPGCRTNPLTSQLAPDELLRHRPALGLRRVREAEPEGDGRERDQRVRVGLDEHVRPPDHPVADLDGASPRADRHGDVDVLGDDGVRGRLRRAGPRAPGARRGSPR